MNPFTSSSSFAHRLAVGTVALVLLATPLRADTVQYTYDSAGRVTGVDYGNGRSVAYTYDRNGSLVRKTVFVITDTDHDGMDDTWETLHFTNLSRDGTGDFDNDGMSDLAEFIAGTLPNDPNSALKVLPKPTVGASSVTIQWASVAGKKYRLQFKNSLSDATWTDVPGDVTATGTASSNVDDTITGGSARFYRVRLVP